MDWLFILFILALLVPYDTMALIPLFNSKRYSTPKEKWYWFCVIIFVPFWGAYKFNKQTGHKIDEAEAIDAGMQIMPIRSWRAPKMDDGADDFDL